jgi:ubiquilin
MSDITVNIKGPSELKLSITISPSKQVIELKRAIASQCDVEAERQRLIFSGRVLKDEDSLETYKIADGHTVHMVKGAAQRGATSGGAGGSTPQPLPTMQSGQNVHDPLTTLNSHQGLCFA